MAEAAAAFVRSVARRTLRLIRDDARFFAVSVAVVALPSFAADLWLDDRDVRSVDVVLAAVTLYLQLLATYRTLAALDLAPPGYRRRDATQGRFVGAFVLQGIAGVGAVIGLVLLVIPGVLLLGLWSLSLAAFASERLSPLRALRRSARLARPMLGRLVLLGAGWLVAALTLAVLAVLPGMLWSRFAVLGLFLSEFVPPTMLLSGAALFAVAYAAARRIETDA